MAGNRILVVEDNQDNMTLIIDVLTSLEYEVFQATDGLLGVQMTEELRPDLVLMDLSLPKKDGWTATREIKAQTALQKIPIIALTAHTIAGDEDTYIDAGCDGYIVKPVDKIILYAEIERFIAKPEEEN